ncbi:MAG: caspase family protein [Bacteroidota bacterium]
MLRILASTLAVILALPTFAQQTPLELLDDIFIQPPGNEKSPGKIRALIVGVSEYRELPKDAQLVYADDDALSFYKLLISPTGGGADTSNVKLLLNRRATAAEIYAGLDWLLESERNDRVIIYFAGHGDVETKTVRQRGFLLAHDSPRAGYQAGGTIKIMDIHDYLETLVTKNHANVLLITDACRAGKLAGGDEGQSQTTATLQEQWAGIVKILSSQPGEKSAEGELWGGGHGVFTYHLIGGLKGLADSNNDGTISLRELNLYLSNEVPSATEEKQNPIVSGNLQLKLSKVNATELALVKADRHIDGKSNVILASRSATVNDTVSEKTMVWYRRFRDALNTKALVNPPGESALHYYRLIEAENKSNQDYVGDLRRALVSALESSAQTQINRYMVNDKTLREIDVEKASVEMKTAVDLLPASDIRHNTLLARQLFLENGFLSCICHGEKSTLEEAQFGLTKLRASLRLEPDAAYVLNSMGNVHYTRGNYDSAKYYYLKASQAAPKWSYPLNNLGTLSDATNKPKDALKYYEAALAIDPDYGHIYNNIGNFYTNLKKPDYKKGFFYYEKALEVDPSSAAIYYYNIGISFLDGINKEPFKADSVFDKMKGFAGAGGQFREVMDLWIERDEPEKADEYRDKAIEAYLDQIKKEPTASAYYQSLASLYELQDFTSPLIKPNRQKAMKLSPSAETYTDYAIYLKKHEDQTDSALYYLHKARAMNSDMKSTVYFYLGQFYFDKDTTSLDSVIYFLSNAEEMSEGEDRNEAISQMAFYYALRDDHAMATETIRRAISSGYKPDETEYNTIAKWYILLEDYTNAKAMIAKAITLGEKNQKHWAQSHILLARIVARQEKYSDALKYLKEASKYDGLKSRDLTREPDFAPMKDDAKYKELLSTLK